MQQYNCIVEDIIKHIKNTSVVIKTKDKQLYTIDMFSDKIGINVKNIY